MKNAIKGNVSTKNNWRNWNIGDKIKYSWDDFDGKGVLIGTLIKKAAEHAIVEADGTKLWLDDFTQDMFCKVE